MNQITEGVRSKNNNVFIFSYYWNSWSRILMERDAHGNNHYIEVNLTAINDCDWERVRSINIRRHGTTRDRNDKFVGTLPAKAVEYMRKHMDEETVERLLHEDFLWQIDWNLYEKHCNGGAPFEQIKIGADAVKPEIKVCPQTDSEIMAWVQQFQPHYTLDECLSAWQTYRSYRDEGQSAEVSRQYAGL